MNHCLVYLCSSGQSCRPDFRIRFPSLMLLVFLASLQWQCQNPEEPPAPTTSSQKSDATQSDPITTTSSAPLPSTVSPSTPSPGDSGTAVSNSCCETVLNPDLKGRLGRLVVNFPEGANPGSTRIEVFKPGEPKALDAAFGGHIFDLLPGTYEVEISKKRLTGVAIQSAHDTRVKAGVLQITAGGNTRVDVSEVDGQSPLTGGFGNQTIGLPVGMFQVNVSGQAEQVTIEDRKVTEF